MKKFLKSNGYYLILVVCVLAVCIAGIAILENKASKDANTSYSQGVSADDNENLRPQTTSPGTNNATSDPESTGTSSANGGSTDVSKPVKPDGTAAPDATGDQNKQITMTKPLSGKIIGEFSASKLVYNKTLKEWRIHPAIDIAGSKGENVLCSMSGTVSDIKNDPLYGMTVIIDNGSGTKTVYCGIAVLNNLTCGKEVKEGQVLGTLGDTIFAESESGTHLHFEVIQSGVKVDPTTLFKK